MTGAMTGHLAVVGLGPGDRRYLTPEAEEALAAADALYGYAPYLDRVPARAGQSRHPSDNREEPARAAAALDHAAQGARVALVSGGDPGVFAMAAAVCAQIESGPEIWRALDVTIVPGVTAMLAVAARIGAPLGHDFCALSLSDNLKPWQVIERRLDAAASAGFVIALYNPVSRARPWQFGKAIEQLHRHLPPSTPVVFGRSVGRADEQVHVTTLGAASATPADMSTLVIVGSQATRVIARTGRHPLVYTPRAAAEVNA
jgi:precorrin-3B C17-methyltransferase